MKPNPKLFDGMRVSARKKAKAEPDVPQCQWDGCDKPGPHRAPVGRMKEGEYFQFCVDHAREYNKGYNYFSGLSNSEVARFQKEALTGHRPTWSLGTNSSAQSAPNYASQRSGSGTYYKRIKDPFGFVGQGAANEPSRPRRLKTLEAKAMETLGLGADADSSAIKTRYKELVKQHHPDANGGDRGSEERFRDVIQAYRLLKQAGFC